MPTVILDLQRSMSSCKRGAKHTLKSLSVVYEKKKKVLGIELNPYGLMKNKIKNCSVFCQIKAQLIDLEVTHVNFFVMFMYFK